MELPISDGFVSLYGNSHQIDPQHYPGEIPIGSDMIHVSGRDRKDDLKDDDLAPLKP